MGSDADATRSQAPGLIASTFRDVRDGDTFVDEPERYEVAGRLGSGGMGVVLAATGSRFGRPVAVKIVTVDRDDLRRRFEREAQITARLQHPAIVPVYGSGARDGQPFYAMKAVSGRPLDQVIAEASTLAQRMALLPKVIAVTEAIAYAHAQRVIHRDLKPANILVGAFGETVVIDWGLAKDLSLADADADAAPAGAGPYRAAGDHTHAGRVMGTPAYMPLEQARGEPVDERADVYALGAITYHVLAGAQPYRKLDEDSVPWESMVARVLSGPPAALAVVAPDVPPDLLAIVARAMSRDASGRYSSAAELADDLRRFQTGQLVGAHRYSTWQLVRRWVKRHRGAVSVAAIALIVGTAGGVLAIDRIVDEKRAAEAARGVAEQRKLESDRRRDAAEKVLDFSVFTLTERLDAVGKLAVMDGVGDAAAAYYDETSKLDAAMPLPSAVRWQQALLVMSRVAEGKGAAAQALAYAQRASALGDQQAASHALERDALRMASLGHGRIAALERKAARLDDAEREAQVALGFDQRAIALASDDPIFQRNAAVDQQIVAATEQDLGHLAAAQQGYAAFLANREAAHRRDPSDVEAFHDVAIAHNELGDIANNAGDYKAALAHYQAALAIVDAIAAKQPDDPHASADVASVAILVGDMQAQLADRAAAEATYERVGAIRDELVKRDPDNVNWQHQRASVDQRLGSLHTATHEFARARVELERNVADSKRVAALNPTNVVWQIDTTTAYEQLASLECEMAHAAACIANASTDVAMLQAIDAQHTGQDVSDNLASAYEHLADGDKLAARWADATAATTAARALRVKILATLPDDISLKSLVAADDERLGDIEAARGNAPAAEPHFATALAALEPLVARDVDVARAYARVAWKLGESRATRRDPTGRALLDAGLAAIHRVDAAALTDDDRDTIAKLTAAMKRYR